uniref:Uncharacterized protein n=1 Tax=Cyclopterus lumpus TaxID=8103 RepID=A0A8C3AC92_CYCLU
MPLMTVLALDSQVNYHNHNIKQFINDQQFHMLLRLDGKFLFNVPCNMKNKLTVLSPFLGAEAFLGNRMSLERDSVDLLRRRGSTAMPMVRAVFLWIGITLSSSRVKPRPARTLVWTACIANASSRFSPADLSGWLVEPGADSFLPVFVEVGVQEHSIPTGGHGCLLLPCKAARHTDMRNIYCKHPNNPAI